MSKEAQRIPLINTQNFENKYARPFFMLEGLLERHPYITPIAKQMVKYPNEFWHMTMVAQAYENIIGSLFKKGYLARRNLGFYDLGTLGAFLHDIGKFGIDPAGIDKSLAIMDFVPDSQKSGRPGRDLRPVGIRANQHLHPLIGGYMINLMGEMGLIPKRLVKTIDSPAFEHHETNDSGFKPSYPRPKRRLDNPNETFIDLLVQIVDAAVGMREKRPYRNELDFSNIKLELELYLQNPELLKHIRSAMNPPKDLKELLIEEIMVSVNSVDRIIREVPDLSLIKWNDLKETNKKEHLSLEYLIAEVWKTQQKRIFEASKIYLNTDYNHSTRK